MAILNLSCICFTTTQFILASSSSPSSNKVPAPNARKLKTKLSQTQQQPSITEIERAIGAGVFRERDVDSEEEEIRARKLVGKDVEKKLRETGTWLDRKTRTASRSAGKGILKVLFIWIIPLWMLGFLVAAGIIQLPFLQDFVA